MGVNAARSFARPLVRPAVSKIAASSTAAARPKRAAVSQPGDSHSRASLDSGTVVPHSSPAAMRAATA